MESATLLTSLASALAVFCFPSEPNIPKGPEYIKNQRYIDARGEVLPAQPINKQEKRVFQKYREHIY